MAWGQLEVGETGTDQASRWSAKKDQVFSLQGREGDEPGEFGQKQSMKKLVLSLTKYRLILGSEPCDREDIMYVEQQPGLGDMHQEKQGSGEAKESWL